MEHINDVCRNEDYPIVVENSPQLGNHAVASRDIHQAEGLLKAIPYAAEVFDNYKKRMCQVCLLYHNRGSFTMRCQDCDQVYFCSETCKAIAMDPQQGCHAKVCRALRKLATWNTDRHTKSIVKLFVQVLMNHWRERQGFLSAYQSRRRILEQERANGNIRLEQIRTQEQEQEQELMKCQSKKDNTIDTLVKDINERLVTINITPALLSPEPTPQPASPTSPSSHLSDAHNNNCNDNDKSQRTQEPIENDFYDVLRLQSHFEDWDDEDQKDWNKQSQTVLSLLELAGLTEMALTPQGPLVKLTSLDIKRLISALESNAFGMFDRTKKKPVCFGRAIYPIASFFNHSCECNATAVQADGSAEEITGNAVLGLVEQEEANKHQIPELSSTPGSESGASTPIQPSTGTATPIEGDEQEGKDLASMIEDPYDSRVGEFRMMTFFAIRDILKGQDITISYIDTEMPLQARRLALLSDYHFHCCCERCLREEKSGPVKTSKSIKKSVQPKPKNKRK